MQVFLLENVSKLGKAGDVVDVRDGYGRNFLFPKKLAVTVTSGTEKQMESQKQALTLSLARKEKKAVELKEKIEALNLSLAVKAGKDGKIFGSITTLMVQKGLKDLGVIVDRKSIEIPESIRGIGHYTVLVKLSATVRASLKLNIVKS